jgi:hypothetical protein
MALSCERIQPPTGAVQEVYVIWTRICGHLVWHVQHHSQRRHKSLITRSARTILGFLTDIYASINDYHIINWMADPWQDMRSAPGTWCLGALIPVLMS